MQIVSGHPGPPITTVNQESGLKTLERILKGKGETK